MRKSALISTCSESKGAGRRNLPAPASPERTPTRVRQALPSLLNSEQNTIEGRKHGGPPRTRATREGRDGPTNGDGSAANQYRACGHFVFEFLAVSRRRLLPRLPAFVPYAALARRRPVPRRNVSMTV